MKFEEILTVIRMEDEMICDVKTGGCGKTNFVHHVLSRCPPIFTIGIFFTTSVILSTRFIYYGMIKNCSCFCGFATLVLEWEKNETETEISETAKALA